MSQKDILNPLKRSNSMSTTSDNAAFYYIASTSADSGYKTLDKALEEARNKVARYGSDYTVFQALKTVKASPKFYAHDHDLSFGVETEAA
jgi:hypothetical protein